MIRFNTYDRLDVYNVNLYRKNNIFLKFLNKFLLQAIRKETLKYTFIWKKFSTFNFFMYKFFFPFIFFKGKLSSMESSIDAYTLNLNFKKNRFFPQLKDTFFKKTIFNNSLGIISKYFSLRKSFLRSKSSYLLTATYLRRLLVNINILKLRLEITKVPKYLKDIFRVLLASANVFYKNPLNNSHIVNEKVSPINFSFPYVFFTNNKSWGVIKRKKRGRLKRKISKKVILLNNILD